MKTIVVNVPDRDENMFDALVKKLGFKSSTLSEEEAEDMATARWIDKGMENEEVSEETVLSTLKKHRVKI